MIFVCTRNILNADFTLGEVTLNDEHFGYTCEDTDRHLETDGVKVPKQTAIPRGRYRLVLSPSARFKCVMPELLNVPQFTGVRVHGGNGPDDTEGCPLLGELRMPFGVRKCAAINIKLRSIIADSTEPCYWEVR